ncbi:MAG: glycosyltransferase family 39 protein, partial [Chloroflexota bacterium]
MSTTLPTLAGPAADAGAPPVTVGATERSEAWVRPAFLGVTGLAAILYLVNLTVSGFANTYYSAAALAASKSWSAWFFGSFDAANFITVDKPPLSTMLMGLSVRLFGLNSWSILLPEALCGVAMVAVLFLIVRRQFGPVAAVIAGLVAALTPAAVLMFRYNNPDALLTLLLVLAAGAFVRALESGSLRWVVVAAVLVGLGFNTKYLQAYLVLPAFAITWAIAAPGSVRRRIGGLAVAATAVIASSAWWVVIVDLIPAANRPFIGGSETNSALELVFGYNGLG